MTKKHLFLSFLLMLSTFVFSQEWMETPLSTNPVLVQKAKLRAEGTLRSGGSATDTLALGTRGFIDDFSNEGPYPDTARWLNNYTFVSRDLPIAPPTLGAVVFDGVNANGYPYDFTAGMYSSGKADTLTSKPIDLYYPGDTSVYFSFYYQPQGRGNFPDAADSLILEFKAPTLSSNMWKHIWAKKGTGVALSDSSWTLVMIKITNPLFLQKGFQFRFTNYATLSGNGDHWSVDYVYLNRNRSAADSVFKDIAFVYNTPSLLNTYSVMPWKQYDPSFMKANYSTTIRNNNNIATNGRFIYRMFDENHVQVDTTYTAGDYNFDPYFPTGYMNYPFYAAPPINYNIPVLPGKTKYTIESIAKAINSSGPITYNDDKVWENDTVRHVQVFDNYYAYDDGTPEVSFGLYGALHAQMAVKYTVNVGDTLRCIDIYFNPQWTDASLYTFKLKVWNATGSGIPGSSLFTSSADTVYHPEYNQSGPNMFTRYTLETPQYLAAGKVFFVGIEQNTTQLINVGVDRNTNANDNVFYNSTGSWNHPPTQGSLMIHPVFGTAADVVGIEEPSAAPNTMTIYPNPATDQLYIRMSAMNASQKMSYTILDIYGRTVVEGQSALSEAIDLTNVANGVYFIRVTAGNAVSTQKFIRSK